MEGTHSLTHSLIQSLAHSPTHSFNHLKEDDTVLDKYFNSESVGRERYANNDDDTGVDQNILDNYEEGKAYATIDIEENNSDDADDDDEVVDDVDEKEKKDIIGFNDNDAKALFLSAREVRMNLEDAPIPTDALKTGIKANSNPLLSNDNPPAKRVKIEEPVNDNKNVLVDLNSDQQIRDFITSMGGTITTAQLKEFFTETKNKLKLLNIDSKLQIEKLKHSVLKLTDSVVDPIRGNVLKLKA